MLNYKFPKKTYLSIFVIATLAWGCSKIVHGYLSGRVFYVVNPFYIQQGVTAVSASLVTDGSTDPLHAKISSLTDSAGNNADSILTTPRSIVTYTGNVTYADSTVSLLKAKLKDSLVRPFNIAEIGGRLQFTAATTFVPSGTYNMDLQVSNVRGTEVLKNACQFIIQPLSNTYNILYQRLKYYDSNGVNILYYVAPTIVDVQHSSGTSKVVYKFVDKNGQPFDPAKGEVSTWLPNYPHMANWDPYYKPVYTDSTIEFQVPDIGISLPYFQTCRVDNGGTYKDVGTCICYYKIAQSATQENEYVQTCSSVQFLTSGIYIVTIHINNVTRK